MDKREAKRKKGQKESKKSNNEKILVGFLHIFSLKSFWWLRPLDP